MNQSHPTRRTAIAFGLAISIAVFSLYVQNWQMNYSSQYNNIEASIIQVDHQQFSK